MFCIGFSYTETVRLESRFFLYKMKRMYPPQMHPMTRESPALDFFHIVLKANCRLVRGLSNTKNAIVMKSTKDLLLIMAFSDDFRFLFDFMVQTFEIKYNTMATDPMVKPVRISGMKPMCR